jgi:inward rectifier potassium channel
MEAELLIMIKGFDDSFAQHVIAKSSYKFNEIDWDVKFLRAYSTDETGEIIVDLEKVGEVESVA